jgi:chromosome segregation protein
MRLNRLDLVRYGRFSDAQITFPAPVDNAADVTIIYGPNEAGKSTAFTAFLELLFGMKPRDHPYDFKFKRSDLLIGAELDLPGRGPISVQRNSKKNQSLVDDQGRELADGLLTSALHGLARDTYVERFSLDDESLRIGGARIAGAQGDLGQLLHAGVSGLTNMSQTLDQMATRADQFHKKGSRSTTLKLGKDRLTEIGQDLRAARLTPDREHALANAKAKAKTTFEIADAALRTARSREAACTAAQLWYDETRAIQLIETQILEFPTGPDLRKGAAAGVASLVATIAEKTERVSEAVVRLEALEATIDNNPKDPEADAIANELEHLDKIQIGDASLVSRAETATSDLKRRHAERDELSTQIDQMLIDLDLPTTTLHVLTPNELEHIAQAAQAVLTLQNTAKASAEAVETTKTHQGLAPSQPQDLSKLQTAWERWQAISDTTAQDAAVNAETARLISAIAGLPKTWSELVDARLPARETLIDIARNMPAAFADLAAAQTTLEARDTEHRVAQSERETDETAPAAINAGNTAQLRRIRNEKWTTHREFLSAQSASDFETSLHQDDDAQASFAAGANARAQLATARRDEAAALVLKDKAQELFKQASQKQKSLHARSVEAAKALGLPADTNPSAFTDRHTALLDAAKIAAGLEIATGRLNARTASLDSATAELTNAAHQVGIDTTTVDLSQHVHNALTLQNIVRDTWDKWLLTQKQLAGLVDKAAQDTAHQVDATKLLSKLTAALPLKDRSASTITAILPKLRRLQQLQGEHGKFLLRIEALEDAVTALASAAARINALNGDTETLISDPISIIRSARFRVSAAEKSHEKRDDAHAQHVNEIARKNAAQAAIDIARSGLLDWLKNQAVEDFAPVPRIERLTERDVLRTQKNTHIFAREAAKNGVQITLFEEELALLPDASRAIEVLQFVHDATESRDLARDAHNEATRLHREAFDAEDRSELATEQATIREELRSGARQAVVARLGVLLAKGALRRLASERRTTMLRDVEDAFVSITAPKWSSVDVWSQAEGEKLVGVQPDGARVPVSAMSTGTMGQLYFALRVAGYRSFARDHGSLPIILDDIMETFDDARAKASLKLCANIGLSGQAIIFTHHKHLVDLARDTIPDVNIIDMPS